MEKDVVSSALVVDAVTAVPPASPAALLPLAVPPAELFAPPQAIVSAAVVTPKVPAEVCILPVDAEKVEEVVAGDSKRRRLKRVVEEE